MRDETTVTKTTPTFFHSLVGVEILSVYKFGSKVICFLRILFTPLDSINEPITNIFVTGAVLHQQKANVFSFAFQALSFDSHNLTVPIIKWLGVLPSDIERYNQHDHKKKTKNKQTNKQNHEFFINSSVLRVLSSSAICYALLLAR